MRSFRLPKPNCQRTVRVFRLSDRATAANFIPAKSFLSRKWYVPKSQAQNAQAQMFSDTNMGMDMMEKNLSMIIPQTLAFAWANFFFSGFVAAKIPFPLTQRFRSMLRHGIF